MSPTPSRRPAIAGAVLVVAVLAGGPGPAAAAQPGFEGWMPGDDPASWTLVSEVATPPAEPGPCGAGGSLEFAHADGRAAGLVWAQCPTPEAAAALVADRWLEYTMYPAGAATALGDDVELVSALVGGPIGLQRLWSQGATFLWVWRTCARVDTACAEASALDARSAADAAGGIPNPLERPARVAGDPLESWAPADGAWQLAGSSSGALDERCLDGVTTRWTAADGARVDVFWMRCADERTALQYLQERWQPLTDSSGLALVFGTGIDRVSRFALDTWAPAIARSWVEGDRYVNVQRSCPVAQLSVCDESTAAYAQQVSALLPGEPAADTTIASGLAEVGWWFVVIPVLTFLALLVPQRVVSWARSRGYDVDPAHPRFTAVDGMVRRARAERIVRRVIVIAATVAVWWWVFLTFGTAMDVWALAWVLFAPFVLVAVLGMLLRLVWRPHALIRVARRRGRLTPLSAAGALVRFTAIALAVIVIAVYALGSMLLVTDRMLYTRTTVQQSVEEFLASAHPLVWGFGALRGTVHALDERGTYALVFLVLLVAPMFLAYLLDRFGQRLARQSLQATLAHDDRPYFLYLRGFDEDRLRVDEAVGRRGLLEVFTPFGRPRFEEVLVEYLTQFGPVVAIAGGRQRIADLGAAKVSLGDHEWRERVQEWSAGARAVVMSATPGEVRAGLEWEMAHVAERLHAPRILLVLAPWPRREVARRWAGFLNRAARWPLFRALAEQPMPSGVQVLLHTPERGWHGYGARRRWDWAYAASIVAALRDEHRPAADVEPSLAGERPVLSARSPRAS